MWDKGRVERVTKEYSDDGALPMVREFKDPETILPSYTTVIRYFDSIEKLAEKTGLEYSAKRKNTAESWTHEEIYEKVIEYSENGRLIGHESLLDPENDLPSTQTIINYFGDLLGLQFFTKLEPKPRSNLVYSDEEKRMFIQDYLFENEELPLIQDVRGFKVFPSDITRDKYELWLEENGFHTSVIGSIPDRGRWRDERQVEEDPFARNEIPEYFKP